MSHNLLNAFRLTKNLSESRVFFFLIMRIRNLQCTDDTSIIQSNPSLEKLSKQVNRDLSNLSNLLRANKLSLHVKIFRPRKLKIDHSFKFKLDGKRLVPTHSVKYHEVMKSFCQILWSLNWWTPTLEQTNSADENETQPCYRLGKQATN